MARQKKILRDEVRDVLLTLMRDETANASARASAARTLLELERESEEERETGEQPAGEMSEREIDQEIARIRKR